MRLRFLFLVLLFLPLFCFAQRAKAPDSAYAFALIDKAENFFTASEYDSALFYCGRAETYSRAKNFKKGLAYSLIEKTDIYIEKDELDNASLYPPQILAIGGQLKDSLITAIAWMQMAQVKMYKNEFDEALALFTKCLQYYLERSPSRYSALAFNDLGYTWGRKGELSKQAICILRSISIYEKYFPGKYGELGVAYNNLSTVYYGLNDRQKAIEYAKKSLAYREKTNDISRLSIGCCNISQFYTNVDNEEAEKYLQLCIKYAIESNIESRVIHSYVTAAHLYNTNKKPREAIEFELKAISLLEKSGKDASMLARRYLAVGSICRQLNKDSMTIMSYFNKSLTLLQSINDRLNLRDLYFHMSNYYQENKNYEEAYENYRKYVTYRDSIISENTQTSIAEIAARYETEKKDNEIVRLNTSQRIKQLEIEKQKALIAGNMLEAQKKESEIELLSKSKALQEATIRHQDEELEKQLLLAKNNEQALKLSQKEKEIRDEQLQSQKQFRNILIGGIALLIILAAVLFNRYQLKRKLEQQAAVQQMRNNIASDLHDDIGASLSSINILNELAKRNAGNPAKSAEYLGKAGEDIQRISESLSDIVWNINPRYDELQNLFIRMKRYASDMLDGKNISYEMVFPAETDKISLSMDRRRDFYLVFKEAINNLVKYSKATSAKVMVMAAENKLYMIITDNGIGFNSDQSQYGNGINNMRKRAESWNDTLEIKSQPGQGTHVRLEMSTT